MKALEVVVGAQYGSEAKGHVTTRLLDHRYMSRHWDGRDMMPTVNLRVAGPNAGHTAYTEEGAKYALRQVPVGATRPYPVTLGITAGSEIDFQVLWDEIDILEADGLLHNKVLYIDPSATLVSELHKRTEASDELVERVGSTGKGIGAARADRIMRKAKRLADRPDYIDALRQFKSVSVQPFRVGPSDHVVIEGTQGYGLGLHGLHYPHCTSSNCRAVDFCAMAGISPWTAKEMTVWAVARMFPIRVAGNSGYLKDETTWQELGLPEERTTVTQKVRRVGGWDDDLVRDAVWANGGRGFVKLALTMIDQKWPELAGAETYDELVNRVQGTTPYPNLMQFIGDVQQKTGATVGMVTTGPKTGVMW